MDHQAHINQYRVRFWVSLFLTIPVFFLSPMIQGFLGLREILAFPGGTYLAFVLATLIFLYGGWPFLQGTVQEIKRRNPGMMTLIGLAITVAYGYSAATVFGLQGKDFFWELASLIDIMLLGHWIEMRSVMGAGQALNELAKLMPDDAHRVAADGSIEDVPLDPIERANSLL